MQTGRRNTVGGIWKGPEWGGWERKRSDLRSDCCEETKADGDIRRGMGVRRKRSHGSYMKGDTLSRRQTLCFPWGVKFFCFNVEPKFMCQIKTSGIRSWDSHLPIVPIRTRLFEVSSHFQYFSFTVPLRPPVGQDPLIIEDSRSHSDTPQSIGLL